MMTSVPKILQNLKTEDSNISQWENTKQNTPNFDRNSSVLIKNTSLCKSSEQYDSLPGMRNFYKTIEIFLLSNFKNILLLSVVRIFYY